LLEPLLPYRVDGHCGVARIDELAAALGDCDLGEREFRVALGSESALGAL
jgi:hypothetical protein